jgi:hypothetical protein
MQRHFGRMLEAEKARDEQLREVERLIREVGVRFGEGENGSWGRAAGKTLGGLAENLGGGSGKRVIKRSSIESLWEEDSQGSGREVDVEEHKILDEHGIAHDQYGWTGEIPATIAPARPSSVYSTTSEPEPPDDPNSTLAARMESAISLSIFPAPLPPSTPATHLLPSQTAAFLASQTSLIATLQTLQVTTTSNSTLASTRTLRGLKEGVKGWREREDEVERCREGVRAWEDRWERRGEGVREVVRREVCEFGIVVDAWGRKMREMRERDGGRRNQGVVS